MPKNRPAPAEIVDDQPRNEATGTVVEVLPVRTVDLDRAVHDINKMVAMKGLEMARAIGGYILDTFFDGDPGKISSGSGLASFRELEARDDLQCSASFLWKAVRVVEQLPLLPSEAAQELPLSHHYLLLPVKSEAQKVALARAAAEEGLTRDKLKERVEKVLNRQRSDGPKVGRRPDPVPVRVGKVLRSAAKRIDFRTLSDEQLAALDDGDRKDLVGWIEDLSSKLERFRKAVVGEGTSSSET